MNEIIEAVKHHASDHPDAEAYIVFDDTEDGTDFTTDILKWSELDDFSDRLAGYINNHTNRHEPIVVYGHKSKYMMVCFMACVKSGHAYVPVDVSVPDCRVQDIIDSVEPEMVLTAAECGVSIPSTSQFLSLKEIKTIKGNVEYSADDNGWLKPEDTFYIIFTSGSTGKPKGVQITTECLTNYVKWGQKKPIPLPKRCLRVLFKSFYG